MVIKVTEKNKLPNIDIHSSSGNITAGYVSNHLIITAIATNGVSASNKNSVHSVITQIIIIVDLKSWLIILLKHTCF